MTPQQKNHLSILHANITYCATKLMIYHKQHLLTIHQWRGKGIIESEEEKIIIDRWQLLISKHDEAKNEALNFELQMSSIRKYQKRENDIPLPMPVQDNSRNQFAK